MKSYNIIFNSCEITPLYISTIIKLLNPYWNKPGCLFRPAVNSAEVNVLEPRHLLGPALPFLGGNCPSVDSLGWRVKRILTPAASPRAWVRPGLPWFAAPPAALGARCLHACRHLNGSMWLPAFAQIPLFGRLSAFYMVLQFFLHDLTFILFVLFFSKSPSL